MQDDAREGGPLAGVRVIDLTMNVLGPLCTQLLGDAGADVIKIESPAGDPIRNIGPARNPGMGAYFLNLNRNKRSVVLDLKHAPAREALLRLVEDADVFVHNMRPGAIRRLGLDAATLSQLNPRLIHASASGFRQDGPYRDRPMFDDIAQGASGLASLNRGPDGAPRYVPIVLADKISGHALAGAIAMALYRRERNGKGQAVQVPMVETMLAFNLVEHLWGATIGERERGLGYTRMLTPHRRPYATSDGHVCVIAVTDEQWRRLFAAIGRPELIEHPDYATIAARARNIDATYAQLSAALVTRSTAEWLRIFDAADLPNGPVQSLDDLLDDRYLQETDFFQQIDHPTEGVLTTLAIPIAFSATPPAIRLPPPCLGAHTDEVLREAGLSRQEIAALAPAAAAD